MLGKGRCESIAELSSVSFFRSTKSPVFLECRIDGCLRGIPERRSTVKITGKYFRAFVSRFIVILLDSRGTRARSASASGRWSVFDRGKYGR